MSTEVTIRIGGARPLLNHVRRDHVPAMNTVTSLSMYQAVDHEESEPKEKQRPEIRTRIC